MEEKNNKKEASKAEQGLFKKLVDATIILAFLTGLLYASGMAYYNAFLKYWGLDALNFARSFHEVAYFGLITVFNFSVSWLPQLVLTISVLALVLMIAIPLSPEFGISKWIRNNIKLKLSDSKHKWVNRIEKAHTAFAGVFLLFFLFGILLASSEQLGKKKAQSIHSSIQSSSSVKLFTSRKAKSDKDDVYSQYYLIACNLNQCAVFWKNEQEVELVKKDSLVGSHLSLPYTKL